MDYLKTQKNIALAPRDRARDCVPLDSFTWRVFSGSWDFQQDKPYWRSRRAHNNQQQSSESGVKTKLDQMETFILNFDLQLAVASPNFRQACLTSGYVSNS